MRVVRAGRAARLQDLAEMAVRRPIQPVDRVPLVGRLLGVRHPGSRPLTFRPGLRRLRQPPQQAVRRRGAVIPQWRRFPLVPLFNEVREQVWAQEISVLR